MASVNGPKQWKVSRFTGAGKCGGRRHEWLPQGVEGQQVEETLVRSQRQSSLHLQSQWGEIFHCLETFFVINRRCLQSEKHMLNQTVGPTFTWEVNSAPPPEKKTNHELQTFFMGQWEKKIKWTSSLQDAAAFESRVMLGYEVRTFNTVSQTKELLSPRVKPLPDLKEDAMFTCAVWMFECRCLSKPTLLSGCPYNWVMCFCRHQFLLVTDPNIKRFV